MSSTNSASETSTITAQVELNPPSKVRLVPTPRAIDDPRAVIEAAVRDILSAIGEDAAREGLIGTPDRFARMLLEMTRGDSVDPREVVNGAIFDATDSQLIVVNDIDFASMCEHHMLPFFGRAHVGYIPRSKIIGLSKIPRIVESFARRLQIQERLTGQVAHFIDELLRPLGVAVVFDAVHGCAATRGVRQTNLHMTTSVMLGVFRERPEARSEFMSFIGAMARR